MGLYLHCGSIHFCITLLDFKWRNEPLIRNVSWDTTGTVSSEGKQIL